MVGVFDDALAHLGGQLPGRGQHQGTYLTATAPAMVGQQPMEHGQGETGRLARACLAAAQHVPPARDGGNGLLLDGGGLFVTQPLTARRMCGDRPSSLNDMFEGHLSLVQTGDGSLSVTTWKIGGSPSRQALRPGGRPHETVGRNIADTRRSRSSRREWAQPHGDGAAILADRRRSATKGSTGLASSQALSEQRLDGSGQRLRLGLGANLSTTRPSLIDEELGEVPMALPEEPRFCQAEPAIEGVGLGAVDPAFRHQGKLTG